MAKVTGPLFSMGARGALGKAIVYSFWKGTNVVREWLKPANPKSGNQGDRRIILGGMGRSPKYVQSEKVYYNFCKAITPSGQSWISQYVRYIINTYMKSTDDYVDYIAAFALHTANTAFYSEALALGLTDFTLPYKDKVTGFGHGLQLYVLAQYACDQYLLDNTKFNAEPYKTALASWDEAKIQLMVADFKPAV